MKTMKLCMTATLAATNLSVGAGGYAWLSMFWTVFYHCWFCFSWRNQLFYTPCSYIKVVMSQLGLFFKCFWVALTKVLFPEKKFKQKSKIIRVELHTTGIIPVEIQTPNLAWSHHFLWLCWPAWVLLQQCCTLWKSNGHTRKTCDCCV